MTRILVADDDRDIRELVVAKLELSGYEVVAFANGEAVLDALRGGGIDLVLLDASMPGRGGVEVCAAVRHDPQFASLPVILLSARAEESDVEVGLAAGATDYVVKPFSPRGLLERVEEALQGAAR
ncbi:MAG TPA: response regulator [Acidimicrobiales bacterium]|nr:response regulator [Acidimicrobiales bacterium]